MTSWNDDCICALAQMPKIQDCGIDNGCALNAIPLSAASLAFAIQGQ